MIGEKIKELRIKNNLTQKELANKLCVTAQAVSRWENNEVEPSVATIKEISSLFNVSVDSLFGKETPTEKEVVTQVVTQYVEKESKPVLAVCEICNKPIYDGKEIVRDYEKKSVRCISCEKKRQERRRKERYEHGILQRKRSFLWSGFVTAIILVIALAITITKNSGAAEIAASVVGALLTFPFLSCLFLENNFVMDMVCGIASWGFIKLPGLIFSLDLDGIIWFITVKLFFFFFLFAFSAACFSLAIALGLIVSVFVYPFALKKNFKNPELSNDIL